MITGRAIERISGGDIRADGCQARNTQYNQGAKEKKMGQEMEYYRVQSQLPFYVCRVTLYPQLGFIYGHANCTKIQITYLLSLSLLIFPFVSTLQSLFVILSTNLHLTERPEWILERILLYLTIAARHFHALVSTTTFVVKHKEDPGGLPYHSHF
ncbi:hypothetical protein L204_105537 [Cryptococcus depauperatus]